MKDVLTADLLAGFTLRDRAVAAVVIAAVAILVALYTPAGVLQVVSTFFAAACALIILRITGPQDVESFRLHRERR